MFYRLLVRPYDQKRLFSCTVKALMKFGALLFSSYSITFCAFYRSRDPISGFFRSKAHFRAFLGALSRLFRSPPFGAAKNQPFGLKSDHAPTATKINAWGRFGRSRPDLCDFSSQGVFKASKAALGQFCSFCRLLCRDLSDFQLTNPKKRPFLAIEAASQGNGHAAPICGVLHLFCDT